MTSEAKKAERRARAAALRAGGTGRDCPAKPDPVTVARTCKNFGAATGETESCPTCPTRGGKVTLKVYACAAFGTCTVGKEVAGRGCCKADCPSYAARG